LIVANDVTAEGAGFDHDTNIVTLLSRDGRDLALPKLNKSEVAQRILGEVVRLASRAPRIAGCETLRRLIPPWPNASRKLSRKKLPIASASTTILESASFYQDRIAGPRESSPPVAFVRRQTQQRKCLCRNRSQARIVESCVSCRGGCAEKFIFTFAGGGGAVAF